MTDQSPPGREQANFTELTADIVSAFVANNSVRPTDLPELIGAVHAALKTAGNPPAQQAPEKPTPAVNPKKSVTSDYIISLLDGRHYQSMKRHLTRRGLTPEQYREMFGLARDYPMVAPNYAKRRSELAKSIGLGQLRKRSDQVKAAAGAAKGTPSTTNKASRKKSA
jgi:predicted transcriptional regulator